MFIGEDAAHGVYQPLVWTADPGTDTAWFGGGGESTIKAELAMDAHRRVAMDDCGSGSLGLPLWSDYQVSVVVDDGPLAGIDDRRAVQLFDDRWTGNLMAGGQ